ncbi:MAG: archaeal heat shock protein Hsp20 [Nitrososphaerales archaeon]
MDSRKFGIDDVFEAMEKMIEDLQEDLERSFKELRNFSHEARPLMYGFTMSVGPDGEPVIKTFGDKEIMTGCREPVYDQFVKTDTDELIVTIEMPGIDKEDIELNVTENNLEVGTTNADRKYKASINLQVPVDPSTASATYRNGILSVTIRIKGKSNKGIKISVK